jgi:hypothetical protein
MQRESSFTPLSSCAAGSLPPVTALRVAYEAKPSTTMPRGNRTAASSRGSTSGSKDELSAIG